MKSKLKYFLLLTFSTLIMAVGTYFFKFTNNFTFGGITGLAVLVAKTGLISASDFNLIASMILLVVGLFVLGKNFAAKTAYCSILLSVALSVMERIWPLDAPLTDQPMLELCFAIALPALGSAVLFNIGSSSGGTDIIAAVVHKYKDVALGRMVMLVDCLIISSCYFVFHDWRRVIFGFVTLFVMGFVIDYIVNSARQSVQFLIFSNKYEEIADRITRETHRGVTVLDGTGWYSKNGVKVLVVLAYKRQSHEIFQLVKDVDPNAFVSQSSVIGVYGEGFDRLKAK